MRLGVLPLLAVALLLGIALGGWQAWRGPVEERRRGEEALARRDYAEARDHLGRYLSARPGDARARILAARAARRTRHYDEATEHLRQARQAGGDPETIEIEFALITIARDGEEPTPALRERAQQGDEAGLAALEVVIQHDIDTYRLYQALDGLGVYLTHRPDDLNALLSRGFVWERMLYFSDAVQEYRRAVAAHPENVLARLKLAEALLLAGTPDEALVHFLWIREREGEPPPVLFGLARCYRRLGRSEEARKSFDALLTQYPEHGEALWERGQMELEVGRPDEAVRWLERAARVAPHDRRITYSLSRSLHLLGRSREAQAAERRTQQLDEALRRLDAARTMVLKQPQNPAGWYEGGRILMQHGEPAEGQRWLRRALRLDPNYEPARAALAKPNL